MSVKNAKTALEGIVLALTGDPDFAGPLEGLDADGLADLDYKVRKMDEAVKKVRGRLGV